MQKHFCLHMIRHFSSESTINLCVGVLKNWPTNHTGLESTDSPYYNDPHVIHYSSGGYSSCSNGTSIYNTLLDYNYKNIL